MRRPQTEGERQHQERLLSRMHSIDENPDGTVSIPPAPPGRGSMYRIGLEGNVAAVNALSRLELNAVAVAARAHPFPLGEEEQVYSELLSKMRADPYSYFERGSVVWTGQLSTLRAALLERAAGGMNAPHDTYLHAALKVLNRPDGFVYYEPAHLTAEYHGQQRFTAPGFEGLGAVGYRIVGYEMGRQQAHADWANTASDERVEALTSEGAVRSSAREWTDDVRSRHEGFAPDEDAEGYWKGYYDGAVQALTSAKLEAEGAERDVDLGATDEVHDALDRGDCGGAIQALARNPDPASTQEVVAACATAPRVDDDEPIAHRMWTPERVKRETDAYRAAIKYYEKGGKDRGVGAYPMPQERVNLEGCSSDVASYSKLWIDVCSSRPSGVLGPQIKIAIDAAALITAEAPWMLGSHTEENVVAILLNNKNRVVGLFKAGRGTMNQSLVDLQGALRAALLCAANGIIFVHNHPGGDAKLSGDDHAVFQMALRQAEMFGHSAVRVIDFVAVATDADGRLIFDSVNGGSGEIKLDKGGKGGKGKHLGGYSAEDADSISESLIDNIWSMADPEPNDRIVQWESAAIAFPTIMADTGQGVAGTIAKAAAETQRSRVTGRTAPEHVFDAARNDVERAARLMTEQVQSASRDQLERYQDDFDAYINQ